jgi:hypothetical protein
MQFWPGCARIALDARAGLNVEALDLFKDSFERFHADGDHLGMVLVATRMVLFVDFTVERSIDQRPWIAVIAAHEAQPLAFADPDQELLAVAAGLLICVRGRAPDVDPLRVTERAFGLLHSDTDPNLRIELAVLLLVGFDQSGGLERLIEVGSTVRRLLANPAVSPAAGADWLVTWGAVRPRPW